MSMYIGLGMLKSPIFFLNTSFLHEVLWCALVIILILNCFIFFQLLMLHMPAVEMDDKVTVNLK